MKYCIFIFATKTKIIFKKNIFSLFNSLPTQVIKSDSRILSDPVGTDGSSVGNSVEFIGSGLGITHGSLVLETDRILQSDPIESDSWI